ncbi:Protein FANTASTIC FOUR 1 [Arabidopsis thaliana]
MSIVVGQAYQHLPKQVSQNPDVGGWSFLQYFSEPKGIVQNREDDTKKTAYVYPIEKRSVAKLSLEMCTESLGTENGSDSGDEMSLLALEATNISKSPRLTTKPQKETSFMTRENSFPPPLNSVNGFNNSRMVKSYKEDGRLVVQAIRVCSPPRCFVSERREGRLRLCLSQNSLNSQDAEEEFEENESDQFEAHDEDEDDQYDAEEEEEEEEEEEDEEGIVGNNENFEGKSGNKKVSNRPKRRCNENGCEPKTMLICLIGSSSNFG